MILICFLCDSHRLLSDSECGRYVTRNVGIRIMTTYVGIRMNANLGIHMTTIVSIDMTANVGIGPNPQNGTHRPKWFVYGFLYSRYMILYGFLYDLILF